MSYKRPEERGGTKGDTHVIETDRPHGGILRAPRTIAPPNAAWALASQVSGPYVVLGGRRRRWPT